MSMEVIRAEFVINTPMFLGEADGECATLIRPPSIKGALRFWWRAMNWAGVRKHCGSDQEALAQLHKEEGLMFGESADTAAGTGGQGCFLLRVCEFRLAQPSTQNFVVSSGAKSLSYLLGQGFYEHPSRANNHTAKVKRAYIPHQGEFTVELALKPGIKDGQRQQLLDTLKCFGLLGCLGSRARKGFGSVSITGLVQKKGGAEQTLPLPTDASSYKVEIKRLLGDCFKAELADSPLTAFSAKTRMQIGKQGRDALALLGDHGFEMIQFRSFGRDVGGVRKTLVDMDAENNFGPDHDWADRLSKKGKPDLLLPKRSVFGLPHPYRMSSGVSVFLDVDLSGNSREGDVRNSRNLDLTRRASPLFAHIHRFANEKEPLLLVQCVLPSLFLPSRAKVVAGIQDKKAEIAHLVTADSAVKHSSWCWDELDKFMDRFGSKDVIHG